MQDNKKNQFVEIEEEVLDFWDKNEIFKQTLDKKSPQGDYVFYDGPPFATGTPHYGHLAASIIKDAVPRFWTMNGYHVDRKWGWDCHGLPIENIVEKELNSKSKKDIEENIGVEKFNQTCRTKVLSYVEEWRKTIKRIGRFVDMDNAYKTMDKDYMESVWSVFKGLWEKELIYKDYRSMHVCPRCETTLSQSEVTEGYKDIKDLSAIAKFELIEEPGTFVLAWTTTPWTLPGNTALAVGEDIDYVKIKYEDNIYILSEERLKDVLKDKEYELADKLKGKELIGKKYKPLFDIYSHQENLENKDNGWKIYQADFVNTDEGTGIVHIAPAFGEDDMNLAKANNIPFVQHLGMDGNFKKEMGALAGLNVKPKGDEKTKDAHMTTDIEIIKYLAQAGLLFSKEKYEHSYPHCWRCDTPLINYATSSWFVNVLKIKDRALQLAKDVNWSPEHMKEGRFGKWLEGARDWSISRQRFWASVIPIWESEDGEERIVIGSVDELEKLSGQKVDDLHKDIVDKITFKSPDSGKVMTRVPDVFDCWFESGSMPYAQMHYPFENKDKFENNFPAEFIAEGADQTRAWFYYLHIIATGLKDTSAFKNVIVNGLVLADDGKKMSKKLKNYPDPADIFDTYGADALRYYMLTSPVMVAESLNFSEQGVLEISRKLNNILWNTYKFYEMYATEAVSDTWDGSDSVLDKWIVARLNQLIDEVTSSMKSYNLPKATRPIVEFIDDLSTWYLRRSRDRLKGDDENDKKQALDTFGFVLLELSKVMAPFTPFLAEQLYQKVSGYSFSDEKKSVHLEAWPAIKISDGNNTENHIIETMETVRRIVELGLAKRDEENIKIRQPLASMKIRGYNLDDIDESLTSLVKDELNIKEIAFTNEVMTEISVSDVSIDGEINNIGGVKRLIYKKDVIELNTNLTPELIAEGVAREVVRFVNAMRKNNDLTIKDRVIVYYKTDDDSLKQAIVKYQDDIKKDTLASGLEEGETDIGKEVEINKNNITLGIKKI